jgi:ribosomal protein S18 acetylase RimI-like enzyme
MIQYRPLDWDRDHESLARLDVSFTTDVIFEVVTGPTSIALIEHPIDPPLEKHYHLIWKDLKAVDLAVVAETDGRLIGVAAATLSSWNRRAEVSHLYVDRGARRCGAGAGLVNELGLRAQLLGARCLWLETQNVNAPAIHFYVKQGLHWCGLDTTLYDPRSVAGETAVFFSLPLEPEVTEGMKLGE